MGKFSWGVRATLGTYSSEESLQKKEELRMRKKREDFVHLVEEVESLW